jgi:hypothetical protein
VGVEVCRGQYRLAKKSLKNWVGTELPTTLHELQQTLGRLLWASPFVPNFKTLVEPIEKLLSPKGPGVWTEECTLALNKILRCIEQRLTLATADPYAPMDVYVSVGDESGLAMLTQLAGNEVRVIALVSRSLTSFEQKRTGLEQRLYIAGWALHRCRRFTTTSPAIRIHLPEPESVVVMRDKNHHLRLEALLVNLKCY